MEKMITYGKDVLKEMDIWDIGLLKCCLLSLGMLIAMMLPKRWRKAATLGALVVFVVTYIPLMYKCCKIVFAKAKEIQA